MEHMNSKHSADNNVCDIPSKQILMSYGTDSQWHVVHIQHLTIRLQGGQQHSTTEYRVLWYRRLASWNTGILEGCNNW